MTIDQSILSDVGDLVAHARVFRALAGAFVRGGGLISAGDLRVTGDPTKLSVNIGTGMALVPYLGPRQYFEPFEVDAPEQRDLNSNLSGASRMDLLYCAVQSLEFEDTQNNKDLIYKPGATPGNLTVPSPDPMAAVLPLASILVPKNAIRGTDCTITMLPSTTAPVRDGGYLDADLSGIGANYCQMARTVSQSLPSAAITSSNFDTTAWTQVNWNTVTKDVSVTDADSMPDIANNRMLVPRDDYYSGMVTVAFPASIPPSGMRGLRVRTIGGGLVGQTIVPADAFGYLPARLTCSYETPLNGGDHLIAEVLQTQGATLTLPAAGGYSTTIWAQQRGAR